VSLSETPKQVKVVIGDGLNTTVPLNPFDTYSVSIDRDQFSKFKEAFNGKTKNSLG